MLRDLRKYDPAYAFVDVDDSERTQQQDRIEDSNSTCCVVKNNRQSNGQFTLSHVDELDGATETEIGTKTSTAKDNEDNGDLLSHRRKSQKRVTFAPVVEMRYFRTV